MPATCAIAALAVYLLLGDPLLGRVAHRRMLAAVAAGTPGARLRFYRQWIWQGWLLMAVTLVVTLGLAHWPLARLGLQLPVRLPLPAWGGGLLTGFAIGAGAALAGVLVATIAMRRAQRTASRDTRPVQARSDFVAGGDNVLRMLPHTRAERRGWVALSITAGITEEVVWRGFGMGLLFLLLPRAHPALPIVLGAIAFGWAHVYQGPRGVLSASVLGAVFGALFWVTGSLLLPIVLHVLVDLRALLLRVPQTSNVREASRS